MTDEDQFERTVRERIAEAQQLTGHSFSGLMRLLDEIGGVEAALRLIAPGNIGKFPLGVRILFQAGLLHLSVEQAVIDFGECGKIFSPQEVAAARDRLQLMRVLLKNRTC